MRFQDGYLLAGHLGRAPIRLHWSIPLGMLLFTRGGFVPGAWLGIFLIILMHELGHAAMVRLAGARVESVEVMALGGLCRWSGQVGAIDRALIAWGGIFAQLSMLLITLLLGAILPAPTIPFVWELQSVMIETNLFIMALNLLPVKPLDGAECWPIFRLLYRRWQGQRMVRRDFAAAEKKAKNRPSHLRVVSAPDPDDPKRDEIFERMLKEATKNPQPIDKDDDN
jgi:stage IV sporulation protein FB